MQKSREAVQLIAGVVIKRNWLEEACYNFKVGQEREPQLPGESSLEPSYWSAACMSKGGLHAFGLDLGVVQEQWVFVYWTGNKTIKCTVAMDSSSNTALLRAVNSPREHCSSRPWVPACILDCKRQYSLCEREERMFQVP